VTIALDARGKVIDDTRRLRPCGTCM